jgi:hypothetical protein
MAEIGYLKPLYTLDGKGPFWLKLVYPDHVVVADADGVTRSYRREELTTQAPVKVVPIEKLEALAAGETFSGGGTPPAAPPIGPGAITVTEEPIAEPGVPVVDAPPPPPAPQPQGRING